jgi:hypothetical protein
MILLYLLFTLPFRVFQAFEGFDFTDLEDFMPVFSLALGLVAAISIGCSRKEKVSPVLMLCMALLSLWPLLPNMGLYFLARELKPFGVMWPQVMVDDPRNWLGHASPRYEAIHSLISYLEAFSGAWMVISLALYFAVRSKLTIRQAKTLSGLYLLTVLVFVLDPGHLYEWWLD